ncbi:MAG: 6-bladed beta-propeller [Candidatus Levybacteria bacterium]|nr:6-bladed beta-propeller [Candidatus Levybacteria bacterium]
MWYGNSLRPIFGHWYFGINFLWKSYCAKFSQTGFTLIELLVAIGIIGVLAGSLLIVLNPGVQIAKAHDAQRKNDLEQIKIALDTYYNDNNKYPAQMSDLVSSYMPKLPQDPVSSQSYCYEIASGGSVYRLSAKLENSSDPQVVPDVTCSGNNYNYAVTSTNTSNTAFFPAPTPTPTSTPTPTPIVPPHYVLKWGTSGSGDGQFNGLREGIAVDLSNNVYVTDVNITNFRIQKFDSSGTFLLKWGTSGSGNGQFSWPKDIAIYLGNDIYVSDSGNRRIQKFNSSNAFILKWGTSGSGNGQFNAPIGIAVDSSNDVYVVDTGNNRIQKFDSSGAFIAQWGSLGSGNGQFNTPYDIAVDSSNNLYVVDRNNNRIQKFYSSGTYMVQWGTYGSGNGQFNWPVGITVDSSSNVYVVDGNNFRIQKFSP